MSPFISLFFSPNLETFFSGAVNGLIQGGLEYAKRHPNGAAEMGIDLAKRMGISEENATAFATGLLEKSNV